MCVMKKLFVLVVIIWFANTMRAQTAAEWLNQKKKQKKYLVQQIAALQVYAGYLSKGYTIVKDGLHTIQNIKHGDLDLHTEYFTSLSAVNSKIKRYAIVADILSMQMSIAKQTSNAIKRFIGSGQFTSQESAYLKNVFNNILRACVGKLDDLYNIITDKNLKMKDDERVEAIDKIYADVQDMQVFTSSFCNNTTGLYVHRKQAENEIIVSKKLNEIK